MSSFVPQEHDGGAQDRKGGQSWELTILVCNKLIGKETWIGSA